MDLHVKQEPSEIDYNLGNQEFPIDNTNTTYFKIKIEEETFPCDTAGCDTKEIREYLEPEHKLQCLIVKILQESETASIHIEEMCAILSRSYQFYYNIANYILVKMIRDLIDTEHFVNGTTIILNEDDHCVLLSCCDTEIKLENDAMDERAASPEPLMSDKYQMTEVIMYEQPVKVEPGSENFQEKCIKGMFLLLD